MGADRLQEKPKMRECVPKPGNQGQTETTIMGENSWHETHIRVRYKDTDRMGVVYYGNYLTFFEAARAELMRDMGYTYCDLERSGYRLVVVEAGAKYHGNVGYDELLTVNTRISDLQRVRVRFAYRVFDQSGRLLVSGFTVHACMNSDGKPARIPAELCKIIGLPKG
jgi:acyl-CoA thioester hydrolase